jgi:Exodeoxyribonuclease VII large subunit (EC 3.1.11.6)
MSSYPNRPAGANNLQVYSVGEIAQAVKRQIERQFDLVRVRGELSGCKRHSSGHVYFSLKDTDAVLDGVCWRGTAATLSVQPQDGIEVIATGRLTTYPGRSKYQMVVEALEIAGEGALLKLLEDRRKALAAEGLFDAARKRSIPFLPEVIGVVTSPTGAVIRDILHRLADRFPRRVLLWPVLVQGPGAAEQVAAAIRGFNALPAGGAVPRPDVLIVARGGGSLEDLWAFNEEVAVRAAAASEIPLIAAVGHETDTTLIDFAADRRAPTPSAAAEMAVPVRLDLAGQVLSLATRLVGAAHRTLDDRRTRLIAAERGLPRPQRLIDDARQRLDDWGERLANGLTVGLDRRRRQLAVASARLQSPQPRIAHARQRLQGEARALDAAIAAVMREKLNRFQHVAALLESYSYERVLERGFALVFDRFGRLLTRVGELRKGTIRLRFADGEATASVDGGRAGKKDDTDQETLF